MAAAWAADGGYTDPLADVSGHEGIAGLIAAVHERFPGFVVITLDAEGRIRQVYGFLDRVPEGV